MIGAMPAVAVRHERRKGQEKRSKRPSQLYIAGHWLPPNSPSPTPSPGTNDDGTERMPEVYLFGKVSYLVYYFAFGQQFLVDNLNYDSYINVGEGMRSLIQLLERALNF